jgi:hypothetical protein
MEVIVIILSLVVLAGIINAFKPLPKCDICDTKIGKKAQIHVWEIDGIDNKLCSKCNRKLESKQHKEKFDAFFHQEDDSNEPVRNNRHISTQTKNAVWRRDQGMCVECGSNKNLEFDHIIPVSKGGSNTTRNIQLLCEGCNRRKSAKIQ